METVIRRERKMQIARNEEYAKIVVNIFKFLTGLRDKLKQFHHLVLLSQIFNGQSIKTKTATICNVSPATICRVMRRENGLDPQISKKPKVGNKKYECDEFCVSMIRRVTQQFYQQKSYPTSHIILLKCKENLHFPQLGHSLFKVWLKEKCKFKYRKINKKPIYLERNSVVVQRETYLRSIKDYRANGYKIYYSDETWASPDQARNRCWQFLLTNEEHREMDDIFSGEVLRDMDGFTGGFLLKSAAGRVIINHIGCEDGFLDGADDVFICKKDVKDYHGNMNYERYEKWFLNVLERIPPKSVIVVDLAPYHRKRVLETINPTTAWRKQQMIDWLVARNIPVPNQFKSFDKMVKAELMKVAKSNKVPTIFCIEQLAERSGKDVKVLWLPPAHCELNPIELVWASVKGYISRNNKGGNINSILELSKQALKTVTPLLWKRCVHHALRYEQILWERDRLIDELPHEQEPQQLLIAVNDDDTTDDSNDDTSDESEYTGSTKDDSDDDGFDSLASDTEN